VLCSLTVGAASVGVETVAARVLFAPGYAARRQGWMKQSMTTCIQQGSFIRAAVLGGGAVDGN